MFCIYERDVKLCPDKRTNMPTGFIESNHKFGYYGGNYPTVNDAKKHLISIRAVERHNATLSHECLACKEFIILPTSFSEIDEKLEPSYILC